MPNALQWKPSSRPVSPSPYRPFNQLKNQNKMAGAASGDTTSQLAWLSSLKTGFNDFTPEQKFLRKVIRAPTQII